MHHAWNISGRIPNRDKLFAVSALKQTRDSARYQNRISDGWVRLKHLPGIERVVDARSDSK